MSYWKITAALLMSLVLTSAAIAQDGQQRPPRDGQDRPQRSDQQRPPADFGDQQDRPQRRGDQQGPPRGQMPPMMQQMVTIAQSESASAVAAAIAAGEMLKSSGPEQAVEYLEKMLKEVKDPAVKRAIRFQLADNYKNSGQQEKALEQYELLMKSQ